MPSPTLTELPDLADPASGGTRRRLRPRFVTLLGVGLPLLVGLVHVALVWPRYHVGSFDDDSSYILTAKALLSGQGLTGQLASGEHIVSLYAPGFGALIAPIVWLWPHGFVALRLFSTACFAAVFPLTWIWLAKHGVTTKVRVATLVVLALGPPFATYASMVMAEASFLVVLLLLLLAVDSWATVDRLVSWQTFAVTVLASSLIWIKEAGLGIVIGLILWTALRPARRRLAKASTLAVGVAATLAPVLAARLVLGKPLAGTLYTMQLSVYYQGGLFHRLLHVAPHSVWHLLSTAIPATLVPYLAPLPLHGHWVDLWKIVSWQVTIFVVVGAVSWFRRFYDAALVMAVVYLGESALWPFVNERRAILVLPLLVAWYVLGAAIAWRVLRRAVSRFGPLALGAARGSVTVAVAGLVVVPLVAQAPRDYLFGWNVSSSHFAGSRYVALLSDLGTPSDVVETDYKSSTALFTGHRTQWTAFTVAHNLCYLPAVLSALSEDHASYMLNGDFNKPGFLDSGCMSTLAAAGDWAVPMLHSLRDNATVYELVGPYSANSELTDVLGGNSVGPVFAPVGLSSTSQSWYFGGVAPVSQVSVGEAWNPVGSTSSVELQLETPGGVWVTVDSAGGSVGGGHAAAPWLLKSFSKPIDATAVRVVVGADGGSLASGTAGADAVNVAVIGPVAATS